MHSPFWCIVLQPAVRMLQTLASDGSVYEVAFVGKVSDKPRFLEYAQGWDPEFSGVQPLLLRVRVASCLGQDPGPLGSVRFQWSNCDGDCRV